MVKEITVSGYEAYKQALSENSGKTVFAIFYSDPEEGKISWCPDCQKADPVVRKYLSKVPEDAVFVLCYTGDRPTWKDPNNAFRKELKVTSVPTLMKIGSEKQLVEGECAKDELVQKFFTN